MPSNIILTDKNDMEDYLLCKCGIDKINIDYVLWMYFDRNLLTIHHNLH